MENGYITGTPSDIQLDGSQSPPSASTEINFSMNLDSTATDNATSATDPYAALFNYYDGTQEPPIGDSLYAYSSTITVFDENGSAHDLSVYMDPVTTTDENSMVWEYSVACDPGEDQRDFAGTDMNTTSGAGMLMTGTMTFDTSGQLVSTTALLWPIRQWMQPIPWPRRTGHSPNSIPTATPSWKPTSPDQTKIRR